MTKSLRLSWLQRADNAFFAPAPAERLAVVRIVIGLFLAATSVGLLPATLRTHNLGTDAFRPVGVLAPFVAPPPWELVVAINVVAIAAGLLVAVGWRHTVTGPLAAAAFLFVSTYRCSWGMIFHSENLLALHAIVIACAPAADAVSIDARTRPAPVASPRYGWPLATLAILTVAVYFMAGVAKLRGDGLHWAAGEFLRNQIAFDNVRKAELGAVYSSIGSAALAHPALFAPLASASLALEVLAPLALVSWRTLRIWAIAIVAFHAGILLLMAVAFPYPLTGAAFVGFWPAERLVIWARARRNRQPKQNQG